MPLGSVLDMMYVCVCMCFTVKPEVPLQWWYGKLMVDQGFASTFHILGTALGKSLSKWTCLYKGSCLVPTIVQCA